MNRSRKSALSAVVNSCGEVWGHVFDLLYSIDLVGMGILSRTKRRRRKAHWPHDGWLYFK